MDKKCASAAICFVAFLPDILDSKAEGRNSYISLLLSVAEKFKRSPYRQVLGHSYHNVFEFFFCLLFFLSFATLAGSILFLKTKLRDFCISYVWTAAGKQTDLENQVGVGGYGYPALVALNVKKGAYAPLRSAFELDQIM